MVPWQYGRLYICRSKTDPQDIYLHKALYVAVVVTSEGGLAIPYVNLYEMFDEIGAEGWILNEGSPTPVVRDSGSVDQFVVPALKEAGLSFSGVDAVYFMRRPAKGDDY